MEENTQSIWDFDRIASCSAIFIALVAMVVALYEARVTREHQEISVWPSLTWYSTSLAKVGDKYNNFGTYIKNDGIGPAIIKSVAYKYKGEEFESLADIIRKVLPEKKDTIYGTDKGVIRVVLPGKEVMLVTTNFTDEESAQFNKLARNQIEGEICYCSLYEKCWVLKNIEPSPVKNCD